MSEHPAPATDALVLCFNLSPDARVLVHFTGCVTQEAVRKLMHLLDASLDTFPVRDGADPAIANAVKDGGEG